MTKRVAILLMAMLGALICSSIHRVQAAGAAQNNYVTAFPLTQNPISESAAWVNGGAPWAGMQTFGGHVGGTNINPGCSGTSPDNHCNDSFAFLAGTWTANQAICATVFIDPTLSRTSGTYEIELHTNQTANGPGYEYNYSMFGNGSQYMQIVRWDGVVGGGISFAQIAGTSGTPVALNNGDLFCASNVAGLHRAWIVRAGVVVQSTTTATDTTYTGGSPGIGSFNGAGTLADNAKFGFSQWEATNLAAQTGNSTDVNAVVQGPLHTLADGDSVLIPPGSYTWTSTSVTANVGASFFGYGIPNTSPVVANNGASASCTATSISTNASSPFKFTPSLVSASLSRLSCLAMPYVGPNLSIGFSVLGKCSSTTCTNFRMDNVTFNNWANHGTSGGISFGIGVIEDMFGVVDHNTVNGGTGGFLQLIELQHASFPNALGNGSWGDSSWALPENYGSSQFLFIENNLFSQAGATENEGNFGGGQHQGGGRTVVRFNTFTIKDNLQFAMGWHGTESNGRPRGGRAYEFYGNLINYPNACSGSCAQYIGIRSGTGMGHSNTINSVTSNAGGINLTTALIEGNTGGWAACDGTAAKDGNDPAGSQFSGTIQSVGAPSGGSIVVTVNGTPGWTTNQWSPIGAPYSMHDVTLSTARGLSVGSQISLNGANTLTVLSDGGPAAFTPGVGDSIQITRAFWCMDQAGGRGAGNLNPATTSGLTTPPFFSSSANEVLSPTYFFNNNYINQAPGGIVGTPNKRVIRNRDYYVEGVNQGLQTSPTVPFDGTTTLGVGQGTGANRPATCTTGVGYWATDQGTWNTIAGGIEGNLYICGASGWPTTPTYTPFTYPHPLVTGVAQPLVPGVSFTPSSVNFGSLTLGATSTIQFITVTSIGTSNLTWTNFSTTQPSGVTFNDLAGGGTCPQATAAGGMPPGNSCTVALTAVTNNVGLQSGTFNFPSNAGTQTVPLTVTGTSAALPGVSITPSPQNYGNHAVLLSVAQTFTITSTTSSNLIIGTTPATITGTNAADFTIQAISGQCTSGQSISLSNFCLESVVFTPSVIGLRTAQLNIFDNVSGSPQVIPLSGNGTTTVTTGTTMQGVVIQ